MPDVVRFVGTTRGGRVTLIETVNGRVRMTTIIGRNGVFYGVEVKDAGDGIHKDEEWVGIWDEAVLFGRDKAHRAGGTAFKLASSYQESLAAKEASK